MQNYKIRQIRKHLVIRKDIIPKRRKFGTIFNEKFDTIVYCIVDTAHNILAGINLVIFKTACWLEKDPSLM